MVRCKLGYLITSVRTKYRSVGGLFATVGHLHENEGVRFFYRAALSILIRDGFVSSSRRMPPRGLAKAREREACQFCVLSRCLESGKTQRCLYFPSHPIEKPCACRITAGKAFNLTVRQLPFCLHGQAAMPRYIGNAHGSPQLFRFSSCFAFQA